MYSHTSRLVMASFNIFFFYYYFFKGNFDLEHTYKFALKSISACVVF